MPDWVKPLFIIFDILALWHSAHERHSARMSKITIDGLTQSGIGCFIAVGIKGLKLMADFDIFASSVYAVNM